MQRRSILTGFAGTNQLSAKKPFPPRSFLPSLHNSPARFPIAPIYKAAQLHVTNAQGGRGPGSNMNSADNPGFDDIILDDALYSQFGMTKEQAMQETPWAADKADPEGYDMDGGIDEDTLGPLSDRSSSASGGAYDDATLAKLDRAVYGPEAVLIAGFRAEELGVVRATLDSAGGHAVKVIPCTDEMLHGCLDMALWTEEIDWSKPRPGSWIGGGAWGSQRAILFAGLGVRVQATILELLDQCGLPPVCATMALEEDSQRRLGEVLAEAVKAHRKMGGSNAKRPAPKSTGTGSEWAGDGIDPDRVISEDMNGLGSLETLIGDKARERLKATDKPSASASAPTSSGRSRSEAWAPDAGSGADGGSADEGRRVGGSELVDYFMNELPGIGDVTMGPETTASSRSEGSCDKETEGKEETEDSAEQRILSMVDAEREKKKSRRGNVEDSAYTSKASASSARASSWLPPAPPKPQSAPPKPQRKEVVVPDQATKEQPVYSIPELDFTLDDLLSAAGVPSGGPEGGGGGDSDGGGVTGGSKKAGEVSLPDLVTGWEARQKLQAKVEGEDAETLSILKRVQAVLKAGVSIEEMLTLLQDDVDPSTLTEDEAAFLEEQADQDAIDAAVRAPSPLADSPASASAPAAQAPLMGPQRPPPCPPTDDPMLQLKPSTRRALEGKNVKFMDLNKLPKKHRQNVVTQLKAQQKVQADLKAKAVAEKQESLAALKHEHEALQQRLLDLQKKKKATQEGGAGSTSPPPPTAAAKQTSTPPPTVSSPPTTASTPPTTASASPSLSPLPSSAGEVASDLDSLFSTQESSAEADGPFDYAAEDNVMEPMGPKLERVEGVPLRDTSDDEDEDEDEDEEDPLGNPVLTRDQLMQLIDGANAQGLEPRRALAEAVAVGVIIPDDVAAELGIELPTPEMIEEAIESIKKEYEGLMATGDYNDLMANAGEQEEEDVQEAEYEVQEEGRGRVVHRSPPTQAKRSWGSGWGKAGADSGAGTGAGAMAQSGAQKQEVQRESPEEVAAGGSAAREGVARVKDSDGGPAAMQQEPKQEQKQDQGPPKGAVMSRAQLAAIAERQGIPLEQLIEDARSKGIEIPE